MLYTMKIIHSIMSVSDEKNTASCIK